MPINKGLLDLIEIAVEQAASEYLPPGVGEGNRIRSPIDLLPETLSIYDEGLPRGEYCGWPIFDEYYRPRRGEWTVVTGIPSHGKTTFVDAMLANLSQRSGWRFAIFSAEQRPIERHLVSLVSKQTGWPVMKGYQERIERSHLEKTITEMNGKFYFLDPSDDRRNLDTILAMTKTLVSDGKIDGLVIDPWNELDATRPAWMNETEFVSHSLSKLRFLARENRIHVWLVVHPAKMYREKDGKIPTPSLYDISGSAHFYNKSDMGICVWRNKEDPNKQTKVFVHKVRFQENGKTGCVVFNFDLATGCYSDVRAE